MQINFGVGKLWFIPSGTNPTVIEAGTLQEVSLDIEQTTKELRGENMFPVDIRAVSGKVGGKIKMAQIKAKFIASVFGGTAAAGLRIGVPVESTGTISGATYTAANTTGFRDLGVQTAAGAWLTRVAATPASGEYAVNDSTAVYTFNADLNGTTAYIRYSYTAASGGFTVPITNKLIGGGTYWMIDMFNNDTVLTKKLGFTAYRALIPKISLPMKAEDYTIQDLDYTGMASATVLGADGYYKVLDVYTSE